MSRNNNNAAVVTGRKRSAAAAASNPRLTNNHTAAALALPTTLANKDEEDAQRAERVRKYKEQRRIELAARTAVLRSNNVTARKPIKKLTDNKPSSLSTSLRCSSEINLDRRLPASAGSTTNNLTIRTTKTSRLRAAELQAKKTGSLEEVSTRTSNKNPLPKRGTNSPKQNDSLESSAPRKSSPQKTAQKENIKECSISNKTDACKSSSNNKKYVRVNSIGELLLSSGGSEDVDEAFEKVLAENGIAGDLNESYRESMFLETTPVPIEKKTNQLNGDQQRRCRSSRHSNETKTENKLPQDKQKSRPLNKSPTKKPSSPPLRKSPSTSPNLISPRIRSNENGKTSHIPVPSRLEKGSPIKAVKQVTEKENKKTTEEQNIRLNSVEKSLEKIELPQVSDLEPTEEPTINNSGNTMSVLFEGCPTENMRLSQRVDKLTELTKKTMKRVDKLASKSNSNVSSSAFNSIDDYSDASISNHQSFRKDAKARGVNERLQDIEAAAQRLIALERQNSLGNNHSDHSNDSSQNNSATCNTPVSILKRKSTNEENSPTPPVTFSLNVLESRQPRSDSRKQGILKKRCSLDESQVSLQRSSSPEVSFADDAQDNNKPILKNRRSSLEDVIRSHSPDGHIQGILKRRMSKEEDLQCEDSSLSSPEPHGILKKKSNSSSSSSSASSHVSIAQAVILAAAGGAEIIDDDNSVRPILKKKSFSEERTFCDSPPCDQPKPILKKKSVEHNDDCDRPKKPILKTRKCEDDGNASSFDLSEDDRSSRRPSLLRTRHFENSDSEASVRPILKQRANSVGRDCSESPQLRLSLCGDTNENNPIVNYLTEIRHVQSPFENLSQKECYPSEVIRRRSLRPGNDERAKSVASEVCDELFTILHDPRQIDCKDSIYSLDSQIPCHDNEETELQYTPVAERIKKMERFMKKESYEQKKHRKNRSNGRFSTQPITVDEMQFVTNSLESVQNDAFRLAKGASSVVSAADESLANDNWRESVLTHDLVELSERAFQEFERSREELQKTIEGLALEDDERSLTISCDSGVYNRRIGEEVALTEPSTTESDPASLDMSDHAQMQGDEVECEPPSSQGVVRSNSVSARASMWQALQEQQAKAVSRPPLRHTRSRHNKENNAGRFRSQQIVWRGSTASPDPVTDDVRSRSFDVDDEDEPEEPKRAKPSVITPTKRVQSPKYFPKPLSKGDSSEGLRDEGIDSSSEDERNSTSSSSDSSISEEPTKPQLVVAKAYSPEPRAPWRQRRLNNSKTEGDVLRLARREKQFAPVTPLIKTASKEQEVLKLKPTTETFVKRNLNTSASELSLKRSPSSSVLSAEKRKFFGLDASDDVKKQSPQAQQPDSEQPKRSLSKPDFIRRWNNSAGKESLEVSEGSDGDSSGGREVRRINTRRRIRASGVGVPTVGTVPSGPTVLQRSATHGDVMPQRGSTIADRLAALQQAGNNEWKGRVCRISPEQDHTKDIKLVKTQITEQLSQPVDDKKKIQVDEKEVGKDILSDRRNKLETASQEWRRRVPEKDADALTVQARMQSSRRTQNGTSLPPSVGNTPPAPSPFKSRRLQDTSNGGSPVPAFGPLRSASCAVVNLPSKVASNVAGVKSYDKFKRSQSVTEDLAGEGKTIEKSVSVITVPKADDETFSSFYSNMSDRICANASVTTLSTDIDVDLDAISTDSTMLLGSNMPKRAKAARKVQSSKNPLRALQERSDLCNTYTEHHTEITNSIVKSASKAGLASEALAALAAREDFSAVSLRSVNHNQHNQSSNQMLLLMVKGRRRVQTRLVEPIASNVNRGDCFVLVTPDKLFLYIGLYSNVIERSRASDIALHIQNTKDLGCSNSTAIITLDESKTINKQHWSEFWRLLGSTDDPKPLEAGDSEEDESFESAIIHTNMVYELIDDELVPMTKYWGHVPKISMLNPSKVIVFDFGSELYVWNGKNVPLDKRRMAANLAQEMFDRGFDYTQCYLSPVNVAQLIGSRKQIPQQELVSKKRPEWSIFTKVTQHMESVLFREKFLDWPDFTRVIKVQKQDSKESTSEIKPCNVEPMIKFAYEEPDLVLEGTHLGRGTQYYDKESMRYFEIKTKSLEKWFVQDSDYHKIENEKDLPIFYSGDSYIIRWEYQVTCTGRELNGKPSKHLQTGRDRFAYFCWQGKDASSNEKGTAALLTVELDKEKGSQMRIAQGSEPAAFLALFNGNLVIRQGKKVGKSSGYELYVVRGCVVNESYMIQTSCSMRQLRSRTSHVLVSHDSKLVCVIHGARSRPHIRSVSEELAKQFAERLGKYNLKVENSVSDCEWVKLALCSKGTLKGAGDSETNEELTIEDGSDHTPRLWQFTDVYGTFEALEILSPLRHDKLILPYPFEQKELYSASQPAMFLLDDGCVVWVWQGWWPQQEDHIEVDNNSSSGAFMARWQSIRQASLETALDYCRTKYGESCDPLLVFAGLEPLTFTHLFDMWTQRDEAAQINIEAGYKPSEIRSGSREVRTLCEAVTFELAALQQRPLPPGLNPQHLEKHLATPDFTEAFGMSRDDFANLPAWKQTQLKKDLGLF